MLNKFIAINDPLKDHPVRFIPINVPFIDRRVSLFLERDTSSSSRDTISGLKVGTMFKMLSISSIDQLAEFLHVDSMEALVALTEFIGMERYGVYLASPYRIMREDNVRNYSRQLADRYRIQCSIHPTIYPNAVQPRLYAADVDCLCDEQGGLFRMRFFVRDNELTIYPVEIYTTSSLVTYLSPKQIDRN